MEAELLQLKAGEEYGNVDLWGYRGSGGVRTVSGDGLLQPELGEIRVETARAVCISYPARSPGRNAGPRVQ
jgi:hypothetical protein